MALIDRAAFEEAKRAAASEWRARGDGEMAAAFAGLELGRCGFGLQSGMRVCWATVLGKRIGLLFTLEEGTYLRSFVTRPGGPPPPGAGGGAPERARPAAPRPPRPPAS
jgi:hypothetical protein